MAPAAAACRGAGAAHAAQKWDPHTSAPRHAGKRMHWGTFFGGAVFGISLLALVVGGALQPFNTHAPLKNGTNSPEGLGMKSYQTNVEYTQSA